MYPDVSYSCLGEMQCYTLLTFCLPGLVKFFFVEADLVYLQSKLFKTVEFFKYSFNRTIDFPGAGWLLIKKTKCETFKVANLSLPVCQNRQRALLLLQIDRHHLNTKFRLRNQLELVTKLGGAISNFCPPSLNPSILHLFGCKFMHREVYPIYPIKFLYVQVQI